MSYGVYSMRVLIVNASSFGGIVHALPVLDYLHRAVPGIEIDWVVEEPLRALLQGNLLIKNLHVVRCQRWRQQPLLPVVWREIAQLRAALRERAYHIVFDLQGDINSGIITWFTACPRRYGFELAALQEPFNQKFTNNQVPLRRQDQHITDRSLRVVSVPFGKDYTVFSLKTDIYTSPEDDAAAELFLATLSDGLVFVLHHGSTWKTKLWHETGWIELGRKLLDQFPDRTILLSWDGQAERDTAERIAVGIGRQTRLLPQMSLKGFAALLKKVDLLVGTDTGPVHIAAAVGVPTVSCYRATDGKRNGSRGGSNRIVQSPLSCSRCLKKECDRDVECRQSISVEKMLQACGELLNGGVIL